MQILLAFSSKVMLPARGKPGNEAGTFLKALIGRPFEVFDQKKQEWGRPPFEVFDQKRQEWGRTKPRNIRKNFNICRIKIN